MDGKGLERLGLKVIGYEPVLGDRDILHTIPVCEIKWKDEKPGAETTAAERKEAPKNTEDIEPFHKNPIWVLWPVGTRTYEAFE